jgi:hypothetical protein
MAAERWNNLETASAWDRFAAASLMSRPSGFAMLSRLDLAAFLPPHMEDPKAHFDAELKGKRVVDLLYAADGVRRRPGFY